MPRARRASKVTEVRITDPRALRALAHPARQRILNELYAGEVLTATDAARLVGLTPSATSYHLRALEKWGVVVRDEPSADGRERPWRAAGQSFTITPAAHRGAGIADSRVSLSAWTSDLEAGLDRLVRTVADGDEAGMASRGRLWLTEDEERDLRKRLQDLFDSLRGRNRNNHPEGARAFDAYALLLPAEAPGDQTED